MKKIAAYSIALLLLVGLVAPVSAGDAETVTLDGEMKCARCTLKEEGLAKCQNVLIVKQDGEETHYWLSASDANQEFGDVCMAKRPVTVTGTVTEKDGKMWLAAKQITPMETKG